MKNIKGAFPVLITPMDEFQEINWNGVKTKCKTTLLSKKWLALL